jgi:LysR family transcriptional regulator (chromosome initiation inhibitor)
MDLLHPQLAAFAAVIDEGSFDAAARRLSVTPPAISQRIKALEDRLGQVLVIRQSPCIPTPAGGRLLSRVRPMQVLESEAMAEFGALGAGPALARTVAIAVNDDSLQTWVMAALSDLHSTHGFLFDVRVDDQDYTIEYLRTGVVLGAVTSQSTPLQGCNVYALGSMRYHAIASPDFKLRHFSEGLNATSLGSAPLIVFNRKDELQWRFMRRITRARLEPPVHYLPTSTGFVEAAARGLGWCLAPDSLVAPALKAGSVAILDRARWLDVALYWQQAAVRSASLAALGLALRQAAATVLHR